MPGGAGADPQPDRASRRADRSGPLVLGLILVVLGIFFLARSFIPGIDWGASWPVLLVGIGVALLLGSIRRAPPR